MPSFVFVSSFDFVSKHVYTSTCHMFPLYFACSSIAFWQRFKLQWHTRRQPKYLGLLHQSFCARCTQLPGPADTKYLGPLRPSTWACYRRETGLAAIYNWGCCYRSRGFTALGHRSHYRCIPRGWLHVLLCAPWDVLKAPATSRDAL